MASIDIRVINDDCIKALRALPDQSVNCCVTSPPYWGLRDYGVNGQIGLEQAPEEWVCQLVDVFRQVKRVLRDDGTLWVNLGDSYNSPNTHSGKVDKVDWGIKRVLDAKANNAGTTKTLKPKDLIGQPWRMAFALQADGWYLRSDIIWSKPNPMPESVKDRPTKAHEYIFLLSKSERYYYDAEAIKEKRLSNEDAIRFRGGCYVEGNIVNDALGKRAVKGNKKYSFARESSRPIIPGQTSVQHRPDRENISYSGIRNKRTVWTVATKPYPEAHFATYPPELIEPCILAGCPVGGTVIDPFAGSGTTLEVAARLGRNSIGIELNPNYISLIEKRVRQYREQSILFA